MTARNRLFAAAALTFAAAVAISCGSDSTGPTVDPNGVAFSFVVLGCNRVAAPESLGVVSTANVAELNRTFADVAAISPKPNFLFFAGDLVFGYTNDSTALDRELKGWISLYQASHLPASGIELITVPGNHETDNLAKIAYPPGERVWLRDMAAYITRGGNGPGIGGADALQTDQSHLSYSFDFKDSHFLALDTDPVGKDWHVPNAWVASDLAAARAKGAKHIFVIAHKPAYPYPTVPTDGLVMDQAARDAYWTSLVNNQVEAQFSAHNHVYYRSQPTGKTWMIIAGNGGTPIDATADATLASTGTYFGYTLVTVTNSGRVFSKSYGRDVPAATYTQAPAGGTTLRDSVEITWK
ncbi:MAG TPA: metallophosphoesterase [Gemmatimonadaceae bacterium]